MLVLSMTSLCFLFLGQLIITSVVEGTEWEGPKEEAGRDKGRTSETVDVQAEESGQEEGRTLAATGTQEEGGSLEGVEWEPSA